MTVTYFGQIGQVRMVYLNIDRYEPLANGLVGLSRLSREKESSTNDFLYTQYERVAIIHLAPGEYLESSNASERS